jgi:hypothetical protein
MTVRTKFAIKLCLAICSALAFAMETPPRAQAQMAVQPPSAVDAATRWMYGLKRAETRVLDSMSAYPFELRVQNAPCACEGGKARDAAQLVTLLEGLMKTEHVKGLELTTSDAKEILKSSLPDWAKRWGKRLPRGARLVHVESSDGSQSITWILLITNQTVRAVWLNAES